MTRVGSAARNPTGDVVLERDGNRAARGPRRDHRRDRLGTVCRVRIATWNVNSIEQRVPRFLP
jgi:hypothetical protein